VGLRRSLKSADNKATRTGALEMNAELEYTVMQHHASELRRAAAEHRRVREAVKSLPSERRRRSVFAQLLAS
jgi:hypothetical protein